jgi:hypothetical protein
MRLTFNSNLKKSWYKPNITGLYFTYLGTHTALITNLRTLNRREHLLCPV